jgi:hypothetical protein
MRVVVVGITQKWKMLDLLCLGMVSVVGGDVGEGFRFVTFEYGKWG